ncbi:hypothetical protein EBB59_08515 [Lysobacter pythonis]|uniref:Toxin co-regulated pilus biosynthesis protein Q C-terminal domain-containing protein n=1 Tax=Solilutibacter pythonis TaxID=2483112 RepID=A0A3M2HYR5_9GAMM|nr:hypothetical protein [Lysobacter pythonis]RMH90984.1 hypothetical protein EBB59_08515 [Lysobacter pythonis]
MVALSLAACGTTPAPEFNGKWQPVNRFASQTQAIPLHAAYTYYATPLDATLKGLLARWAENTGMTLSYQSGSDYTLHLPVAEIRTTSAAQAAEALDRIYAAQGLQVALEGSAFVVRPRPAAEPVETP